MFSANFEYYRAGSVAEAISLLGQHDGAKLLAEVIAGVRFVDGEKPEKTAA